MIKARTCLLLLCAVHVAGCSTVPRDLITDDFSTGAYRQILKETEWIDGPLYGFGGDIENITATAMCTLVRHKRARDIFLQLLSDAEPAGKLYALCGLYHADWERFQKEVMAFQNDEREIASTSADVVLEKKICDIVFCPYTDSKRIVLKKGQLLQQWFKENKAESGYGDISGGYYPEMFIRPYFGED